jgi:hypothetical protein
MSENMALSMKLHSLKALAILVVINAPLHAQSSFPDHCPNQSPLPFAAIELKHPIDSTCSIDGQRTASANSRLQNAVKNNFCAASPTGQPETFNIEVCKAGTPCDENNDSDWLAFDTWWKSLTPLAKPKGPHTHTPHEPGTTVRKRRNPTPPAP